MVTQYERFLKGRPKRQVEILYIDQDYQIFYWLIQDGSRIISKVSLPGAIEFLNSNEFDLILSEPQNLAVIKNQVNETQAVDARPGAIDQEGSGQWCNL
jgi:hypothetical protein